MGSAIDYGREPLAGGSHTDPISHRQCTRPRSLGAYPTSAWPYIISPTVKLGAVLEVAGS